MSLSLVSKKVLNHLTTNRWRMLKNKIDFIANQCPVLHEYLDNLPSQHVSNVEEMGEKVKSFFDIKYYSLLTSSLNLDTIKSLKSPDYNAEVLYNLVKKVIQAIFQDEKILIIDFKSSKYVYFMNP